MKKMLLIILAISITLCAVVVWRVYATHNDVGPKEPSVPSTTRGGGLTGEAGDSALPPIGMIEMYADGTLSVTLGSWDAPQEYSSTSEEYQKWISHVGGLVPGEKKSIPPLQR